MSEKKPKGKRGRHPLEGEAMNKAVFVRMTEAQRLRIAALAAGVPLATYLRQRGLAEKPREGGE